MATRRRSAAAAPVAVTEDADAFTELEDAEELEELEEASAPKARSRKATAAKTINEKGNAVTAAPAPKSEFNSSWLASHVSEATGDEYTGRDVRMILRKLADNGTLAREVGEDRSRYEFPKGANDPTVKAVIAHIKSGASVSRRAPAAEDAPAPAKKTTAAKKTAKAAAPQAGDEGPVETTRTRTRRKGQDAPAAPAKATPAKRTRRAATTA